MLIKRRKGWEIPESKATSESVYHDRRRLVAAMGLAPLLTMAGPFARGAAAQEADPSAGLYPVSRNAKYTVDRPLTDEKIATTYNNFYEFGSHKNIYMSAQKLPIRPWAITIDGLCEHPQTIDIDALLKKVSLEERVYRFRCVEAWAMTVPWSGFPMAELVKLAGPKPAAKYVRFETFKKPEIAPGQKQFWYPWPYVDALTIEEATNELAFMATGLYGKPIPRQNGAPIRFVTPWKYGFKQVKSISRITFTDQRPKSFWEALQASEYGFWANVNPEVAHPRWSQASERLIGNDEQVPTKLYNGYAEFVAHLYKDKPGEKLFM
jgi:methionine sulfoxide reductase catalytic subunit